MSRKKIQDQVIFCKNVDCKNCFIVCDVLQTPCRRARDEVSIVLVLSKKSLEHIMRSSTFLFVAACLLVFSSCSANKKASTKTAATPKPTRIGTRQVGIASWYGDPYHGRKAASGEVYNMNAFTAAHKSLPFETWVRVKNLSNKKITEVRITDRGPFVAGRIIDLSRASAQQIELIGPGTAKVRIEVIRPPKNHARSNTRWWGWRCKAIALTPPHESPKLSYHADYRERGRKR